jgi:hypothetical protein
MKDFLEFMALWAIQFTVLWTLFKRNENHR